VTGGVVRRKRRRAAAAGGVLLVAATVAVTLVGRPPRAGAHAGRAAQASSPVEARCGAAVPLEVTTEQITDAAGAATHEVFRPADLGADGTRHPIVTWGNGSGATPSSYAALLRHLASWGFVVVVSTSTQTGTGEEILAGVRWLVEQDGDPASAYFGALDTTAVAAVGHSQGAGGSVRAAVHGDGLITTVVPIQLPAQIWVSPGDEYDVSQLRVPVLFLGGGLDLIISAPWTLRAYYDQVPGPAALGVRAWAGHLAPTGDGDGFRGYLTAWLRYRLAGDAEAAAAFAGPDPELLRNPAWQWQATNHLTPVPAELGAPA